MPASSEYGTERSSRKTLTIGQLIAPLAASTRTEWDDGASSLTTS